VNFIAYLVYFLSLITTLDKKKKKLGIENQFLPSSRQECSGSGGKWFIYLLGKGERKRGKGVRVLREIGRVWDREGTIGWSLESGRVWDRDEVTGRVRVVAWSGGNWERKEIVWQGRSQIFCISNFAFGPVTFRVSRENVMFLTFLRDVTVLCNFNDFRVLPPFLHILWVLTRKIVWFYELKHIFNNHGCDRVNPKCNHITIFFSNSNNIIFKIYW